MESLIIGSYQQSDCKIDFKKLTPSYRHNFRLGSAKLIQFNFCYSILNLWLFPFCFIYSSLHVYWSSYNYFGRSSNV